MKMGDQERLFRDTIRRLSANPTISVISKEIVQLRALACEVSAIPIRVGILRNYTIEPLLQFLEFFLFEKHLNPSVYIGNFGVIQQELLDSDGGLYKFNPDVVFLLLNNSFFSENLNSGFFHTDKKSFDVEIADVITRYREMIDGFRANSDAVLIVPNLTYPDFLSLGILDASWSFGKNRLINFVNGELTDLVKEFSGVYVLDMNYLQSFVGISHCYDTRMNHIAKLPFATEGYIALMRTLSRYAAAVKGVVKKCLVLDLDGTIWGGIVGEEGLENIGLGNVYPGSIFVDIQKMILSLYQKGVILAVNSKNNEKDAMEVFEEHPDMVLKKHHFVIMKINWNNKADNLLAICSELNLSLNSIVYIDDNPAECELIKNLLPEVEVFKVPQNVVEYPCVMKNVADCFGTLQFSHEDTAKAEQYRARNKAEELKRGASSLDEYFRSLDMRLEIEPAGEFNISRIVQLTQKTNQFNLTTKRYSEPEIRSLSSRDDRLVCCVRLIDTFGNHGIIGVSIVNFEQDCAYIDTFLLSCRVIDRGIEKILLSLIIQKCQEKKIKEVIGEYILTAKNQHVGDFYSNNGFIRKIDCGSRQLYSLSLKNWSYEIPDWIELNARI